MTEQEPPAPQPTTGRRGGVGGTAVLGAVLIVVGIAFFIGQQVDIRWGGETWPFWIIGGGVVLAALGLMQPAGSGLTVAGSILAVVGGLLLYQSWNDHYESWAYAWALVAPGGSGLGMLLHGTRHGNPRMARDGFWQVLTAAGIFVVGLVFFEGIIGLSGDPWSLPQWILPVVIIGLGALILVLAVIGGREEEPA